MPKVIPALTTTDTSSWITGPLARGRALLANYLVTDRWQSHSYADRVFSSVDIMQEKQDDETDMRDQVRDQLTAMFKLHFDTVDVSVDFDAPGSNTLNVGIGWKVDGVKYTIASRTLTTGDTLTSIANTHNTGHPRNDY